MSNSKPLLTDFDRGLGYGLVVALACSVGAFWLGQDHAPRPTIAGSSWIPVCPTNPSDGANVVEISGEIAETCNATTATIECQTDDITP